MSPCNCKISVLNFLLRHLLKENFWFANVLKDWCIVICYFVYKKQAYCKCNCYTAISKIKFKKNIIMIKAFATKVKIKYLPFFFVFILFYLFIFCLFCLFVCLFVFSQNILFFVYLWSVFVACT